MMVALVFVVVVSFLGPDSRFFYSVICIGIRRNIPRTSTTDATDNNFLPICVHLRKSAVHSL